MNTAIEQFVSDFTLVVDNDREAYDEARQTVANTKWIAEASDAMREQYEQAISECLDVLRDRPTVADVTVDLMAQILLGWGSDAFDRIARHYQESE